ncbi:Sec1-like protein [Mytilinidion resinicola]|uniref:Sec1-like protein n=1 Tax=Mytilinidion resinicola TaxID=574789 RepID=A0A6A6YVX1_9PEZI|nr:Sec1-like protein [Mytilinidion resinicola]KAF2812920.1 Sec1-like protein [Mytilinidion resinicola]
MGASIIDTQRQLILDCIKNTGRGEWKVLIVDETSQKLIANVVKEDDILNEQITNIERIEERRPMNKDMDAIYFLTAQPHIVDCVMADFERRRYRGSYLIWTSLLPPPLRERIDRSAMAREQIRVFKVLEIDYYPRESHLVTLRDPWSFPVLFHPACNNLVRNHMEDLAQKIVAVCVSLGEYPTIRYYRPRNPSHEASVLCSHLARFVQEQIDMYAQYHENFPPQSNRPRGALYITDRSMDLFAPLLHEFTYQAMAHDLLPIKEGEKVTYKTKMNEGRPDEEEKEMEISEKDKIWVENRHRHMKDTIEKLMGDFQRFLDENPQFTNQAQDTAGMSGLNAIKDMIAGLPQFQEMKEAYSLHLSMAQECMQLFQQQKLPDLASVEQTLATGLDEDYRKPKNVADQIVRTLDEDSITHPDRLRLIALYLLYRDGLLPADLMKLLAHAQLPPGDGEVVRNLDLLGARVARPLKDNKPGPPPIFANKPPPAANAEEYALSRYTTALQHLLEAHVHGTLDQTVFPYTKPNMDAVPSNPSDLVTATSLRSAKPTWAKSRLSSVEPRQRVIVFMAGGATYSESRACYEVSAKTSRDVFLVTSHMLTPALFVRQVGDLSVEKRRLGIPAELPKPKAPAHLFERDEPPKPAVPPNATKPKAPAPPTAGLAGITLNSGGAGAPPRPTNGNVTGTGSGSGGIKYGKEEKKKKKHHFFGSSK